MYHTIYYIFKFKLIKMARSNLFIKEILKIYRLQEQKKNISAVEVELRGVNYFHYPDFHTKLLIYNISVIVVCKF